MKKFILFFLLISFALIAEEPFLDEQSSNEEEFSLDTHAKTSEMTDDEIFDQEFADDALTYEENHAKSRKKYSTYRRPKGSFSLPLYCGHLFIEGEYLFWKPYGVIPYAARQAIFPTSGGFSFLFQTRKFGHVSMKAHSGYRVKLGFYLPVPTWYVSFEYTQFFSDGVDSLSSNGRATSANFTPFQELEGVAMLWAKLDPASGSSGPYETNAYERLRLKIVDGDLSRTFVTSSCFTFDPFISVRYARVKLDTRIDYKEFQEETYPAFGVIHVDLNNHFNGVGLRAGFHANWILGCGFEIFGKTSLSGLVGTYYIRNRNEGTRVDDNNPPETFSTNEAFKYKNIQSAFQFASGLIWGTRCRDCYYFGVKVGYEVNIWPEFIKNMITNVGQPTFGASQTNVFNVWNNNLTMHGLTVSVRLDF